MIKLTKLNGEEFFVNHLLVEKIDVLPNSIITMNSQVQYVVKEDIDEIKKRIIEFNRQIYLTA